MKKPMYVDPSLQLQIEKRALALSAMKDNQYKRLLRGLEQHFANLKAPSSMSSRNKGKGRQKGEGRKVLRLVTVKARRRASRVTEACVGLPIRVHNGREWKTFLVSAGMVGYPVGAFVATRTQKAYRVRGSKK